EDACKSGFLDYIDGLSFHPYRINSYPENLVNWQWSIVKSILGKYAKREIPLFVTENGYSTATQRTQSNGLPILWTEDDQAALLCRILLIGDMLNFPINTIYEWKDRSDDLTDVESSFGIVHSDLTTKKPAYDAIKTLIRELSGYTFAERVMGIGTANDYILKYFNGTKVKYVYWTTLKEDDNHTIIIERNQLTCGFTPKIFESSQPYSKSAKTADIESNGLIHQMNWYGLNQVSRKFEAAHQVSLGTGTSRGDIKDNGLFYGKQMTGMPVSDGIISPPDNMFFKQLSSIYTINALMQIGYDNWSGNIYSRGWADLGTGYAWTNWKRMLTTDDIHLNAEQTINLSNGAKIYLIVIPIFWRKMIFGSFSIPSANVTATLMNLGNLDASLAPNRFSAIPVFMDRISEGNKPQCVLNLHSIADSGKIELMLSSIAVLSGNINGNFMYLK
ncbi:hypothetical protein P9685_14725, partial [Weizmannia sp. CD-2023]|nr:hypothetical protein [Weizmannia sp. CD-2023]